MCNGYTKHVSMFSSTEPLKKDFSSPNYGVKLLRLDANVYKNPVFHTVQSQADNINSVMLKLPITFYRLQIPKDFYC